MRWPLEAKVDSHEAVVCDSEECCGQSLWNLSMALDCGGAAALKMCCGLRVCVRKSKIRRCERGLRAPERCCA